MHVFLTVYGIVHCSEQYDAAFERASMLFNAGLWYMKHSVKLAAIEEYVLVVLIKQLPFILFCYMCVIECVLDCILAVCVTFLFFFLIFVSRSFLYISFYLSCIPCSIQ